MMKYIATLCGAFLFASSVWGGAVTNTVKWNVPWGDAFREQAEDTLDRYETQINIDAAGASIPLASNKVLIGNSSGVGSAQTVSGLFTTDTGGVASASTTGLAATNSTATATVTAGSLSVSTNATGSATVTAGSLSVATNATGSATVTAGSLSVSTNATGSATVTPASLAVATNVALTTAPVLDAVSPTFLSVIYFTNATLTVLQQTTLGWVDTGVGGNKPVTNAAGASILFVTNTTVTALVVTNNLMSGITSNLATVVSNATIQTATLNYAATNDPAVIITAQNTTLNYAATNDPAVTVTAQNTTLNYAATNDPAVTITAQNTTLNYAATNAPTVSVSQQTATFVKP